MKTLQHSVPYLGALLLALTVWAGCDSGPDDATPTGSLSGFVREADTQAPIPNVNVTLGSTLTTTDQEGRFAFHDVPVSATMRLSASAARFDDFSENVAIQEGSNTRDIVLVPRTYYTFNTPALEVGLYLTPGVSTYRGVILFVLPMAWDGRGFASGNRVTGSNTSDPGVEERINAHVTGLRQRALQLAQEHGLALMGVERLGSDRPGDVLEALVQIADQSGHPELAQAPLLLGGHSAGGCYAYDFTIRHPARVTGFMTQKGQCHNTIVAGAARLVPGYLFIGEEDLPERAANITQVFEANRVAGALWAVAVEPGTGHEPVMDFDLFEHWMDAVLEARLPAAITPGQPVTLNALDEASGWLGNRSTFEIAAFDQYDGDPMQASWLPTMQTAQDWRSFVTPPPPPGGN